MTVLPPELLHDIARIAISACIDDILGYWWQYTEDSVVSELIQDTALSDDVHICEVPSDNPVNALLSTSSQIRLVTLRILSNLLDIALDEAGIGSLQTSPWAAIHDAETVMKKMVLVMTAQSTWAEPDAILRFPRSLQRYLTMFILELHYVYYRVRVETDRLAARALLSGSTEPNLQKQMIELFKESTPDMLYVSVRHLHFNVLTLYHQLIILEVTMNGAVKLSIYFSMIMTHTHPSQEEAIEIRRNKESLITTYPQSISIQYSRLRESIEFIRTDKCDFGMLGRRELQKSIGNLEMLREYEATISPGGKTALYEIASQGIELLETALSDSDTVHPAGDMTEQSNSSQGSHAIS